MISAVKPHRLAATTIALSFLISVFFALTIELGNDEVYYVLYIKHPALSYFDHPGMLGWLGWVFTIGGTFITDFTVRLGPILFSVLNQIIIYRWLYQKQGKESGFIALLLYNASLYLFLISGVFLLPDSFQLTFWLLSLLWWYKAEDKNHLIYTAIGGVFGALALATKYHAVCLPAGLGLYYLFTNWRQLFSSKFITYCLVFSLGLIPTLFWNLENNWASFSFHGDRVGFLENGVNFTSFTQFLVGQFLYYNPIIVFLFLRILLKDKSKKQANWLLFSGLALILISTLLSLSKTTLPHWTGPAFIGITIWLALNIRSGKSRKLIYASICLNAAILISGWYLTNHGSNLGSKKEEKLGKNDATQDLYGWKQLGEKYRDWLVANPEYEDYAIITLNWFPASHLEHYVKPGQQALLCIGNAKKIHEFERLNERYPDKKEAKFFLFLHQSNGFHDRVEKLPKHFTPLKKLAKFSIFRSGQPIRFHELYLIESSAIISSLE